MPAPTTPLTRRGTSGLAEWAVRTGRALAVPVGSVIFAFIVGGVIVAITGSNPIAAYQSLICGGFGVFCAGGETPAYRSSTTIVFTTPLSLTGLSVSGAFLPRLFNVCAVSQVIIGSIDFTAVGLQLRRLS